MNLRINFSSGVPIYLQLIEQIKHAVETGAIRSGEQLPTIRSVAEAYRELERESIVEVRHGSGVFVAGPQSSTTKTAEIRKAGEVLRTAMEKGMALDLSKSELRRVFEDELSRLQEKAAATRRRT